MISLQAIAIAVSIQRDGATMANYINLLSTLE